MSRIPTSVCSILNAKIEVQAVAGRWRAIASAHIQDPDSNADVEAITRMIQSVISLWLGAIRLEARKCYSYHRKGVCVCEAENAVEGGGA